MSSSLGRVILLLSILCSNGLRCPTSYQLYLQSCYMVSSNMMSFEEGLKYCTMQSGGVLMTVHSDEEQVFMSRLSDEYGRRPSSVWLYLKDSNLEEKFEWLDGSPLDYTNWGSIDTEDSPFAQLADDAMDCVVAIGEDLTWQETSCLETHGVVCEHVLLVTISMADKLLTEERKRAKMDTKGTIEDADSELKLNIENSKESKDNSKELSGNSKESKHNSEETKDKSNNSKDNSKKGKRNSKEENDNSKEVKNDNKERKDDRKDGKDDSKERKDDNKDRKEYSKERKDDSKEGMNDRKERKDESKEIKDDSKERKDDSNEIKDDSKERKDDNKDRKEYSKGRKDDSKEGMNDRKERKDESKEGKSNSKERKDDSKERKDDSKEGKNESKERKDDSKERKNESKERKDDSKERKDDSKERKDDSKEGKDDSKERKDDSKEGKDDSTDRKNESKERKDDSKERKDDSKEGMNDSTDRKGDTGERKDINKETRANVRTIRDTSKEDNSGSFISKTLQSLKNRLCSASVKIRSTSFCGWAEDLADKKQQHHQAEKKCTDEKKVLLRPTSMASVEEIKDAMKSMSSSVSSYWIDLTREGDEFKWSDGNSPSWTYWSTEKSSNEKDDCVIAVVEENHMWKVENCHQKHNYMCQDGSVDGNWSEWEMWSGCSVTCGSGKQTRTRLCNNPTPSGGGNECTGDVMETKTCTAIDCPIDGNWSQWEMWSGCSVTCGSGKQTRTRLCNNPTPSSGGNECTGDGVETKTCTAIDCPIDGNWSEWEMWSGCSVTCGSGKQTRTRLCNNPTPSSGGNECTGDGVETKTCTAIDCPIDGNWSEWEMWSGCSETCGSGKQTRTRLCNNPTPSSGGKECIGDAVETKTCTAIDCPIDGNWSEWEMWSDCSVTCGSGKQTRTRLCNNPTPSSRGKECIGDDVETKTCTAMDCPIDGDWSAWQAWSDCSVTCGAGQQSRKRICNNPVPLSGGLECQGDWLELKTCQNRQCSDLTRLKGTLFEISPPEFGMIGYELIRLESTSLVRCALKCVHHKLCKSFNFEYKKTGDLALHRQCVLNSVTKREKPDDFVTMANFQLYNIGPKL